MAECTTDFIGHAVALQPNDDYLTQTCEPMNAKCQLYLGELWSRSERADFVRVLTFNAPAMSVAIQTASSLFVSTCNAQRPTVSTWRGVTPLAQCKSYSYMFRCDFRRFVVTHDAVPAQHEPPSGGRVHGRFLACLHCVMNSVDSDFCYSPMACFAIRVTVEEYALLNALLHMFVAFKRTWELKLSSVLMGGQLRSATRLCTLVSPSLPSASIFFGFMWFGRKLVLHFCVACTDIF